MLNFSIVLIARNETRSLGRLVASLQGFIQRHGEIVLLDTGSNDGTPDLARDLGCVVHEAPRRFDIIIRKAQAAEINDRFNTPGDDPLVIYGQIVFDFSSARQHAASLASQDFVLHLDASDVVLAMDLDFLHHRIAAGDVALFGYGIEYTSDRPQALVTRMQINRFYDRRLYHWEGVVHEGLYRNPDSPTGLEKVDCAPGQLLVRHLKNESKKRSFYVAGLALNYLEHPENPRWAHYLGRELYYIGRYQSALDLLEEHASMQDAWSAERNESLCFAGSCCEALGQPEQALSCYSRAFAIDSSRREPLLRLADLCLTRDDFQGAVAYAQAALSIQHPPAYIELEINYTYRPHAILYRALYWLDRKAEAAEHFALCRQLDPVNEKFLYDRRFFES
jgi:glycosyltransferase involved in cell wall biosynthesis